MPGESVSENLLHLALYVASLGLIGVVATAIVERMIGSSTPLVGRRHILIAAIVLAAVVGAELLYHAVV